MTTLGACCAVPRWEPGLLGAALRSAGVSQYPRIPRSSFGEKNHGFIQHLALVNRVWLIIVLIFGTKKADATSASDLGSAVKGFKDGMKDRRATKPPTPPLPKAKFRP